LVTVTIVQMGKKGKTAQEKAQEKTAKKMKEQSKRSLEEEDDELHSDTEPAPAKKIKGKQLVMSCVTTDKTYRDNTTRFACWAIAYNHKPNRFFLDRIKLMTKDQLYRLFGKYEATPNNTPDKRGPKGKFIFDDAAVKGAIICWDKDQVRVEIGDSQGLEKGPEGYDLFISYSLAKLPASLAWLCGSRHTNPREHTAYFLQVTLNSRSFITTPCPK
jgi:hypothetical protein